jgi:quercetin dioxygenase-like cupin family protein
MCHGGRRVITYKTAVAQALAFVVVALVVIAIESASAQVPGRCETPASQRAAENGCYVSTTVVLGELPPGPLFWHLVTYPDRGAAEAASGPRATIVEAFGKVWLYAIAEQGWRSPSGEHVIALGPLELYQGRRYTAHYVEAVFPPGMKTTVHRHPGPEASYVIEGQECVETPKGVVVSRAGQGAVVGQGVPMQLHNPGPGTRRAVALILHESSHHWSALAPDWTPKGLCSQDPASGPDNFAVERTHFAPRSPRR